MENFCITADWLQIHCHLAPFGCHFFTSKEYQVERIGQSKVFENIYSIKKKSTGEIIGNFAKDANEKILPPGHGILKIDNKLLYQENVKEEIKNALDSLGLVFDNITRLDLAIDFETFKNGLHPQNFIKKYLNGQYLKSRTAKCASYFVQREGKIIHTGLSIGSKSSNIAIRLYNKSFEQTEKTYKPYIGKWHRLVFGNETNIWRLEFTIKNFIGQFGHIYKKNDISQLDVLDLFDTYRLLNYLIKNNFSFKIAVPGQRLARCKEIIFFEKITDSQLLQIPKKELTAALNSKKTEKNLIKKLANYQDYYILIDKRKSESFERSKNELIKLYGLEYWAMAAQIMCENDFESIKKPSQVLETVKKENTFFSQSKYIN